MFFLILRKTTQLDSHWQARTTLTVTELRCCIIFGFTAAQCSKDGRWSTWLDPFGPAAWAACAGAGRGRDDKVARRRPLCRNDGEAKKNGQGYGKDGRDVETWRLCRVPVLCQVLVYAQHHPLDSDLISSYLCLYLIIHSFIYLYFFYIIILLVCIKLVEPQAIIDSTTRVWNKCMLWLKNISGTIPVIPSTPLLTLYLVLKWACEAKKWACAKSASQHRKYLQKHYLN